ncbi:MAG: hypothetical protein U0586_14900 [Candidatus Brocadiaceae bacterium]
MESLIKSGNELYQLTGDQPDATTQQLKVNKDNLPVFVNQDDVPAIVSPAGLSGKPSRGIMLSDDIPDNIFALIRLSAVRASNKDFSFVDGNGHAKAPNPVFRSVSRIVQRSGNTSTRKPALRFLSELPRFRYPIVEMQVQSKNRRKD